MTKVLCFLRYKKSCHTVFWSYETIVVSVASSGELWGAVRQTVAAMKAAKLIKPDRPVEFIRYLPEHGKAEW